MVDTEIRVKGLIRFAFQLSSQEKEKEILYLQSELERAVQEKSDLKLRLNHLERSEALKAQRIESFDLELDQWKKLKADGMKGNEKEISEISNKIREKISVRNL